MTKRKMPNTGWVDYAKHPRGPNGRGLCRMCGEEVPKGRRTFCGKDCVHQYKLRNSPHYASVQLRKKHKEVCAICQLDTTAEKRKFYDEWYKAKTREEKQKIEDKWEKAGWAPVHGKWYQVDHIISVAEGGGPQDYPLGADYMMNLRILCSPCHKKETRELHKRLKGARKIK